MFHFCFLANSWRPYYRPYGYCFGWDFERHQLPDRVLREARPPKKKHRKAVVSAGAAFLGLDHLMVV